MSTKVKPIKSVRCDFCDILVYPPERILQLRTTDNGLCQKTTLLNCCECCADRYGLRHLASGGHMLDEICSGVCDPIEEFYEELAAECEFDEP